MKKYLIIGLLSTIALTSCKKDITDFNHDPKSPTAVPSGSLFTAGQTSLARLLASANVNIGILRLVTQQWQETTYTDESNYDLVTRGIPTNNWDRFYVEVLKRFDEAKKVMADDIKDEGQRKNMMAITDIMEVHTWYLLVTTFGDVPYSEALDPDNVFPKYDDATTIYKDLLSRLAEDVASLDEAEASFGNEDVLYAGDVAMWKKYGNALRLEMAMTIADADNTLAQATAEAASANLFTSNADNALFRFSSIPPNTNPVWEDLVQSGRQDFVACNTYVVALDSLSDPRLPFYFTTDENGGYSGGMPGASSSYSQFSKPNPTITAPDYPGTFLSYSQVEFLLAEAASRGYAVTGSAEEHYNAAITASILEWGGTDADAVAYLAQPEVAFTTAAGTDRQKIGFQEWLGFYNRQFEAWIAIRKHDVPSLPMPENAYTEFPVRYTYSVDEQNINVNNYNSASAAIGGDEVTTKLFFDKF